MPIRTDRSRIPALFIAAALATPGVLSATQDQGICRLCTLRIEAGMNRSVVEEKVAALVGTRSTYSPYANNLQGGTVSYRDNGWVLQVTYRAGAPAPWVQRQDGTVQHLEPSDETVVKSVLLNPSSATGR